MKISNLLLSLLIVAAFSFISFIGTAEASCWLNPNGGGGQNCTYSLKYVPMIDLPGVTNPNSSTSFASYASALYSVAIVVAALLAVIRLVIAGAKYMMTDVVSGKGQAINDIKGSLLGLLIIISAFVILNTINPNLTKISIVGVIPNTSVSGDGMSGLIWTGGNTNVTTPGSSGAQDIQGQLSSCSNLVMLPDGSRCCNDTNSCPATNTPNNTPFVGFNASKIYTTQEVAALLQANQSVNFVDLGPFFAPPTQTQIDTYCSQAALARNTTVASSFVIQQNAAYNGIRVVQPRPICILN